MKAFRLLIAFSLSLVLCYASDITDLIYSVVARNEFKNLGTLQTLEAPCDAQREGRCDVAYRIPGTMLRSVHGADVIEIGVGIVAGSSEWLCKSDGSTIKVFDNNQRGAAFFREGLMLYGSVTIPTSLCKDGLLIRVSSDSRNFVSKAGWKTGALVVGNPAVVRSYKNVIDFFSSYFRILLSLLCFLLLLVSRSAAHTSVRGYPEYRLAILLLSAHFLASSSIFDVLVPNSVGLGFLLLMAGGTSGCFYLVVSAINASGLIVKNDALKEPRIKVSGKHTAFLLLLTLAIFYYFATGRPYLTIQSVLATSLLLISAATRTPSYFIFSALFVSNVLAGLRILPGYPTNSATHFMLILFITDFFEGVHINNVLLSQVDPSKSMAPVFNLTSILAKRFLLNRISTSMFAKDYEFVTKRLFISHEEVLTVEKKVSRLAAHVMTARTPLLRIKVGSEESRILKGAGSAENAGNGREFCIFPLVRSERVLGTLNISGYPIWALSDPSQMSLFLSMINRVLPRLADTRYREDLSPNIEDQHSIREIETTFLSRISKTKGSLLEGITAIAKQMDARIILSRAIPEEDKFATFSNHHYGEAETRFLEDHAPKLSGVLLASPSNVAYHRRSTVYIGNIESMFSIYPDFLVKLLKGNGTRGLFVKPIYAFGDQDTPWGVIWFEFSNRIDRSEMDLKELAEFASNSIERSLNSFFEFNTQQNIVNEISSAIPKYVLEKIKRDVDPREQEEGYLLNIDLAGSTALSKAVGSTRFAEIISSLNELLTQALSPFSFLPQIIVWDSFAFTRSNGKDLDREDAEAILRVIDTCVSAVNDSIGDHCQVSFRAVLAYGDITRDWSRGNAKYWTITGSAYAESCKLESELKPQKRALLIAKSCPGSSEKQIVVRLNEMNKAA